ncbi:26S proteasome subunit RPN7-domain-containing protein [Dichotomocladium elegans]|nr:26S proteasome subunit RPN7-domain-containing protein [Dichotomocladium elegans]
MTIVNTPSHLDFESYIGNYAGRTAIDRAIFIAEHCTSLQVEALQWAAAAIKKDTLDTSKYASCITQLNAALKNRNLPSVEVDQEWIRNAQRETKETRERLENNLKTNKNSASRENIWNSTTLLGNCFYQHGDMTMALKTYVRSRDYCTNSISTVETCFNVIKVAVEQSSYAHVNTYVNRAEAAQNVPKREIVQSKLECCRALSALFHKEKLNVVADALTKVDFEMGNDFNQVISANDVAVYGGLCALASYDRQELKTKVLSNSSFKNYLELEPQIREMIDAFYNAKYAACLELLESYRNDFLLDMHLAPHVNDIIHMIRVKSMVQYCVPYGTVDLQRMAVVFGTTTNDLQNELASLIAEGDKISARIDSHQKILIAKERDQRQQALKRSMVAGTEYEKSSKALMLRMRLLKADMIIKSN